MSRKVYEISFNIAGQMGRTFSNAFSSSSQKIENLRDSAKDLKGELRKLDREYRNGSIAAEDYQNAHKRLTRQLDRSIEKQQELRRLSNMRHNITVGVTDRTRQFFSNVHNRLTGVNSLLISAGAMYAGKQAFDATIAASAQRELNERQIKAMFGVGNEDNATEYMNMLDKMAIDSPVLNSKQMFGSSKGFIGNFKDSEDSIKLLEDTWKITEKLVALDPIQGVEGAALALKELLSGDSYSLVERFELSRSALNDIKKLDPEKQLRAMDKLLQKMGITNDFVAESGKTAIGQWNQIGEKVSKGMQKMGEEGLQKIKPELQSFNRWLDGPMATNIQNTGSDVIGGFVGSVIDGVHEASNYINNNFVNNPEFQNLEFSGKVGFIVEDIGERFDSWFVETGAPAAGKYGTLVGKELISSMAISTRTAISESPMLASLLGGIVGLRVPGPLPVKIVAALSLTMLPWVRKLLEWINKHEMPTPDERAADYLDRSDIPKQTSLEADNRDPVDKSAEFLNKRLNDLADWVKRGSLERNIDVIEQPDYYGEYKNPYKKSPNKELLDRNSYLRQSNKSSLIDKAGKVGMTKNEKVVINAPYSPVINGVNTELIPEIKNQQNTFMDQLDDVIHQKRRITYE